MEFNQTQEKTHHSSFQRKINKAYYEAWLQGKSCHSTWWKHPSYEAWVISKHKEEEFLIHTVMSCFEADKKHVSLILQHVFIYWRHDTLCPAPDKIGSFGKKTYKFYTAVECLENHWPFSFLTCKGHIISGLFSFSICHATQTVEQVSNFI